VTSLRVHPGFAVVATLIVFVAALLILESQRPAGPASAPTQHSQVETKIGIENPPLTGVARVIDGDTIDIHGTHVRLDGIDAPEAKQTCEANDKKYPCGLEATEALIKLIGASRVECTQTGTDRYARIIAKCKTGTTDIGSWMVEHGWAVAFRKYSMAYVAAENQARSDKLGMWSGTFTIPEEWRKKKREGNTHE
jgi:endonuclease YncB( thermonuclease family)